MWRGCAFEPALDGGDHEIANHLAGDTGVRHGRPGDDLAVTGIEHEQDPDDLAIPGMQLEVSEHHRIFECSAKRRMIECGHVSYAECPVEKGGSSHSCLP
jgi:hypothetical protein